MTPPNGFVAEDTLQRVPSWRNYLAAKLGFRNHWYPIKFSGELPEGETVQVLLCGENILMKRIDGKVHALKNRCLHRGVRLSEKIECYTKNTITCWYHGFTYKWDTGELCDIIAVPDSKAIGHRRIKTYPVTEAKGMVFVFIGDDSAKVPPLAEDVPPFFLDDDMAIESHAYDVNSNWRIGCENGFDGIHVYIHRISPLMSNTGRSLPLGHLTVESAYTMFEEEGQPKGLYNDFTNHKSLWEGKVEGKVVVAGTRNPNGPPKRTSGGSLWLPCALRVDGFPDGDLTQFEWYVPITEDTHRYFIALGKRVADEAEAKAFAHEFHNRWKRFALEGFNGQDIMAREALQQFYGDDRGWLEEGLIEEDALIIKWRELCHRHNRGVQTPRHLW
jgi:carbazole 1,9a-dioxygenase terminal dioxygenase component